MGRQYLANLGKIDNGVVSVSSVWADEQMYYPLDVEPYTPAAWFEHGKANPAFRTKLKIALGLVQQAINAGVPFRAVVADNFYGEDRTFRRGLAQLGVGYVLALKPSFAWWHRIGDIGSPEQAARAARWASPAQPGAWVSVERSFRDGHTEQWWAFEVVAGPFGPERPLRRLVITTDPSTLPALTTWHLISNLPAPGSQRALSSPLAAASVAELVRLYGLRTWVEPSYKQVKHTLGWADYQVRSDRAIRWHWTLVCCAFTFCWWQVARRHDATQPSPEALPAQPTSPDPQKKRSSKSSLQIDLAPRPAPSQSLARTLHLAQALLASLFTIAPAPALAATA